MRLVKRALVAALVALSALTVSTAVHQPDDYPWGLTDGFSWGHSFPTSAVVDDSPWGPGPSAVINGFPWDGNPGLDDYPWGP
jgi:Spy/CpxP family protein refolding chaperone